MLLFIVVLDRRYNPDADTGTFELAYRQVIPKAPAYLGLSLCINGKRLIRKAKERKHERHFTPLAPRVQSGDAIPDAEQPPEYNGPIITDFLSWLNPYDSVPMNKDGLLLGPKESLTVRQAVAAVKSSKILKNCKRRKTSALSSRPHRRKNAESKRKIVPHSCCRPEDSQALNYTSKYRTESSASKSGKPKIDRSVGNKRCYIDPIKWERETASIIRSTISVQNKMTARTEIVVPIIRQTKSEIVSSQHKFALEPLSSRSCVEDANTIKKLSAIGKSIYNLRDENYSKKVITFSKSCTSLHEYTPYRVTVTPLKDNNKMSYLSTKTAMSMSSGLNIA